MFSTAGLVRKKGWGRSWETIGRRDRTSTPKRRAKYRIAPSGENIWAMFPSMKRSICEGSGVKAERLWERHRILTAYFLRGYSTHSGRVFSSKPFDSPFIISIERGCSGPYPYFSKGWSSPCRSLRLKRRRNRIAKSNNGRCLVLHGNDLERTFGAWIPLQGLRAVTVV